MKNLNLQALSKTELIEEIERFSQRELLFEATEILAHVGHYEWDYENDSMRYCSQEYASLFGLTVEEAMEAHSSRDKFVEQIHPDDRETYRNLAESFLEIHSLDVIFRIILKNGQIRYLREIGNVVIKDDQKAYCYGIVQDISDITEHERDLVYRDNLSQSAEEMADLGYYIFDLEAEKYDYISPGFGRIHGVSCETYLQKVISRDDDMTDVHVDDYDRLKALYQNHSTSGGDFSAEYRIYRADGEIRWIREASRFLTWEDSNRSKTIGVLQDITEQKQYRQELESRDLVAQQTESITDIGHCLYYEGIRKFSYISPGFARIHGVSQDEYMSRAHSMEDEFVGVHEDDLDRVTEEYEHYLQTHEDCAVEYRLLRADGKTRWIRELATPHKVVDGKIIQTLVVVQDITTQKTNEDELLTVSARLEKTVQERTRELADTVKRLEEEIIEREKVSAELKFLANHDALTGLPSLRLCKDRLERSLFESRRSKKMTAVMFIDLDGFKAVNDTYGHEFGDVVLRTTADRIKAVIREIDTVARIGGDEFIIIMSSVPSLDIVQRVAANLIEQVSQVIQVNQIEVSVSASLGIALYPEDGTTSEELIRRADSAMYQVKNSGKNNYGFYQPERLN